MTSRISAFRNILRSGAFDNYLSSRVTAKVQRSLNYRTDTSHLQVSRFCTVQNRESTVIFPDKTLFYFHPNCGGIEEEINECFQVIPDFITCEEESNFLTELEPHLKRMRYEFDHWDDAIVGFRELEVSRWSVTCTAVLQRLKDRAFGEGSGAKVLLRTHVLDLAEDGHIKPHVDSVKFCGTTITGLCLNSSAVMRLVRQDGTERTVDVVLPARCLYIMKDSARYHYTHEVLSNAALRNAGRSLHRTRRISVLCRNQSTQ